MHHLVFIGIKTSLHYQVCFVLFITDKWCCAKFLFFIIKQTLVIKAFSDIDYMVILQMARIYSSSVISFHKFIQIETQNLKSYEDPQEEVC